MTFPTLKTDRSVEIAKYANKFAPKLGQVEVSQSLEA